MAKIVGILHLRVFYSAACLFLRVYLPHRKNKNKNKNIYAALRAFFVRFFMIPSDELLKAESGGIHTYLKIGRQTKVAGWLKDEPRLGARFRGPGPLINSNTLNFP